MKKNKTCLKILRYRKDHPFVFYSMILYLGAIIGYVIVFHLFFADFSKPMLLNEIGDFLAGVFAPVAFFYLYLGYIQQGTELKENTRALRIQADELKNSVKQQEELVKTTREELDLTKSELTERRYKELVQAQPYFHIENITMTGRKDPSKPFFEGEEFNGVFFSFEFSNSRAICRELRIYLMNSYNVICDLKQYDLIEPDIDKKHFYGYTFYYPQIQNLNLGRFKCNFQYSDSMDDIQFHDFVFTISREDENSQFKVTMAKGESSFQ